MQRQYLLNEYPLIILPSLAKLIGLNEAIVLQQLHYWICHNADKNRNFKDGHYWTYNSYKEWEKEFPFWSSSTIKRTFTSLEKQNLVISANYNKLKIDKTKWYTIDYKAYGQLTGQPMGQNDLSSGSKWSDEEVILTSPLPDVNSETSSETTNSKDIYSRDESRRPTSKDSAEENICLEVRQNIIGYLNKKCKTQYKATTKTTTKHINARFREGFTEDDFVKVIDKKVKEWKGTDMEKYLRPQTLFGTKFESYLNQKIDVSEDPFERRTFI